MSLLPRRHLSWTLPGMSGEFHRRLAAVMALDIAGYSRLTEADVEGTHLARFVALLQTVIEPRIAEGGGRIVKRTGDGALVEFPSVSSAIRAATQIQQEAIAHERDRPMDRQLRLRIGINLGDVIVEADDIYGDGVNIAARLEGLGQPGDVIVSDAAMQTTDRNDFAFLDLGVQRLKNISRPVRAYRVVLAKDATGLVAGEASTGSAVPGFRRPPGHRRAAVPLLRFGRRARAVRPTASPTRSSRRWRAGAPSR